jgi:hypothetical protein
MNKDTDIEQRVSAWLESEARGELADWVLDEAFAHTRTTPQDVPLRSRLRSLRPGLGRTRVAQAQGRYTVFTAMRATVLALLIGVVGLGVALVVTIDDASRTIPAADSPTAPQPTELLDVTFDSSVIPDDLAGVLFSRKSYPTDQEIMYTDSFLPPNTFIRQVESGELGIRPAADAQVVRAGTSQALAEVVAAGEETTIGPGDTLIQRDVPWIEFGKDALGEMWTPGDDAVVFSLAIREQERCCSMNHPGMSSRWYHTLVSGVQDLNTEPIRFRVRRWDIPVGESLAHTNETTPTLWAVDTGEVSAMTAEDAASNDSTTARVTRANEAIVLMTLTPGDDVVVENVGDDTAVLYQLIVEPTTAG